MMRKLLFTYFLFIMSGCAGRDDKFKIHSFEDIVFSALDETFTLRISSSLNEYGNIVEYGNPFKVSLFIDQISLDKAKNIDKIHLRFSSTLDVQWRAETSVYFDIDTLRKLRPGYPFKSKSAVLILPYHDLSVEVSFHDSSGKSYSKSFELEYSYKGEKLAPFK